VERCFNTAGPIKKKLHYFLPQRLDVALIKQLIEYQAYFILHAPRQTGKTTAILALAELLMEEDLYSAVYVNVESAQAARGNVQRGIRSILSAFKSAIRLQLGDNSPVLKVFDDVTSDPFFALHDLLQKWAQVSPKPLILLIDEIDSLIGDTLISVLRQLRTGYVNRPEAFPQSICMIGVRDVRDYRIFSEEKQAMVLGGSAFNIKSESLLLRSFSEEELRTLYLQHMEETGQVITDEAITYAFQQTQGQPWLVNALGFQACFRDMTDRLQPITLEVLKRARNELILRQDTHLDSLLERLKEERVANIIDAIFSGRRKGAPFNPDDLQYTMDLGIVREEKGVLEIANPIYREIIPRALTLGRQKRLTENQACYLHVGGKLNMEKVLTEFAQFYRENSAISKEELLYKESGPHLILMAYLQRIINGGGHIHREYALGRGRVDLFVEFQDEGFVLELKIYRGPHTVKEGLAQTAEYMATQGAREGHLVLFDPSEKSWDEKIYHKIEQVDDQTIHIWGL